MTLAVGCPSTPGVDVSEPVYRGARPAAVVVPALLAVTATALPVAPARPKPAPEPTSPASARSSACFRSGPTAVVSPDGTTAFGGTVLGTDGAKVGFAAVFAY